jgi:hypothetical protein
MATHKDDAARNRRDEPGTPRGGSTGKSGAGGQPGQQSDERGGSSGAGRHTSETGRASDRQQRGGGDSTLSGGAAQTNPRGGGRQRSEDKDRTGSAEGQTEPRPATPGEHDPQTKLPKYKDVPPTDVTGEGSMPE